MKFGGASVRDAAAIRNVAEIIIRHAQVPLLIVVSAMDKTTNHLELLAQKAKGGERLATLDQFEKIIQFHIRIIRDLFGGDSKGVEAKVAVFFDEMERIVQGILLLEEFPPRTYDRIVSYGELLATTIVSEYLTWVSQDCIWLDARKLVKTDATHGAAEVIWSLTGGNIRREVKPLLKAGRIAVTQGFIGATIAGKVTTLGREGSDYTASIFAHSLDADSLIVWKDVPGVLNADPRLRDDTVKIDNLSYEEAVEMTFYGATVIHPNTIKPIYNKKIPLYVKCFLDVSLPGTCISDKRNDEIITSYIVKKDQAFVSIKPLDFSFMEEQLMQEVFNRVYKSGVKVSLVQNSAISLMLCVDQKPGPLGEFQSLLMDQFQVEVRQGLQLHTVFNFTVKDLKLAYDSVMVQQHGNKLFFVK